MIIECLNEALDFLRPYGPKGMPIPWLTCHQHLSFFKANPSNIEKMLCLAISKVLEWGSYLCGFIPEKIEIEN